MLNMKDNMKDKLFKPNSFKVIVTSNIKNNILNFNNNLSFNKKNE